jgi:hypothetical protein
MAAQCAYIPSRPSRALVALNVGSTISLFLQADSLIACEKFPVRSCGNLAPRR